MAAPNLAETERWFIRRGLPHLISDYNAAEDVFTRALPVLTLVFLLSMIGALSSDFSVGANIGIAIGGLILLLGIWAGANWLRGIRPLLARPQRVGGPELAVFVLGPAVVPLVFGGQFSSAAITLVTTLLLLVVIYLVTSFGVVAIFLWAVRQLFGNLTGAARVGMRALPLLLLFNAFLFINAEVWQVTSRINGALLVAGLALFVLLGLVFLLSRLPGELNELATFQSWSDVDQLCAGTPAAGLEHGDELTDYPLSRRQRGNVGMVLLFSQAVLVMAVSIFIGLFFVIFGMLVVNEDTLLQWTQQTALNDWYTISFGDDRIVLSEELFRAAGFLAIFSGLYFTVNAATEPTYRQEFFDDLVGEVRQSFAVREAYLSALARQTS